jgi:predicted O-linked N-acetylglucosamine transferase (SPINDLY family)
MKSKNAITFKKIEASLHAKQYEAVRKMCSSILRILPRDPLANFYKAKALLELGNREEALRSLQTAREHAANNISLLNQIGLTLSHHQQAETACQLFSELVQRHPENNELAGNYLATLNSAGAHQQAADLGAAMLEKWPDHRQLRINYADTLRRVLRHQESLNILSPLIIRDSLGFEGHMVSAFAFFGMNHYDKALTSINKALALKNDGAAWGLLGTIQRNMGEVRTALISYQKAIQLRHRDSTLFSDFLFCSLLDPELSQEVILEAHQAYAARFSPKPAHPQNYSNLPDKNKRLKIGLISGDFISHPVAMFVMPTLAEIDPAQIELIAFSNNEMEDAVSAQIKKMVAAWYTVERWSDDELESKIRALNIDILIDLSGHTGRNRLPLFARKPAPLQLLWKGYPNTTGLRQIDYFLTDPYCIPKEKNLEKFWSEKIIRIPNSFTFSTLSDLPEMQVLPALKNAYFSFASFNRPEKINHQVIALWSKALHTIPNSRMLIAHLSTDHDAQRISQLFEQHGIHQDRLQFHVKLNHAQYLDLHHDIDFILDAFPWNGSTITYIALQMGVPTLTLSGNNLVSMTGAAIMRKFDLHDWVADSEINFIERLKNICAHPEELALLRASLRDRFMTHTNNQATSVAYWFEKACRVIWHRWCEQLPAASFELTEQESVGNK